MTEARIVYFKAESDRNLVEREFNGKKFMSISEIKNLAESYNSIIRQIIDAELESNLTPHEIAEDLYYNADWAYISTYIMELTIED